MNKTLRAKIVSMVQKVVSKNVAKAILKEIDKDLILPMLSLTAQTSVEVETDEEYVTLYIGPRNFQFYLKSGKLEGCGTFLG